MFNRELLALERDPQGAGALESITLLFRSAHSLKGASHAVGESELEALCHGLEELLADLRDGRSALDPELFSELFAAVDRVTAAGVAFTARQSSAPPAESGSALALSEAPRLSSPPPPARADGSELQAAAARAPQSTQGGATGGEPGLETVRIPGRRLDDLLARTGELQVARLRLDARREELHSIQELVARLRGEWRTSTRSQRTRKGNGANGGNGGNGGNGANGTPAHQTAPGQTSPGKLAVQLPAGNGASTDHDQALGAKLERTIALTRQTLARLERDLDRFSSALGDDVRQLARVTAPLAEQIHQARLLPFLEACEGLPRTVRDLTRAQHKDAQLVIEGADTELDRSIIDALRDPLLHLIRNAVDHGVELPERRLARGKSGRARIVIAAAVRGEVVEISVSDDGRGIDLHSVRERALELGIEDPGDARSLLRLIFTPGFSTASAVTHVSGRGVGLDVVQARVEAMRGQVEVGEAAGGGARFTMTLPLTLTSMRVVFVRAAGDVLALPATHVLRMLRVGPQDLRSIEGKEMLALDGAPLPVLSLGTALGAGTASTAVTRVPAVLIESGGRRAAFIVDELLGQQEVVSKPLGRRLGRMRWVSSATLLPNGRVALVLKPSSLIESAYGEQRVPSLAARFEGDAKAVQKRLLLVDDSVTTRTLEKSILEAAGYVVLTASDGSAAWQLLQEHGADLVLSDVEMPNLDGIGLARTIRGSKRFRDVPIVLLTALASEQDRERGLQAGADAYLVKGAFDQRALLETLRELL